MVQKVSNDLAQTGVFLLCTCKERRDSQYYLLNYRGIPLDSRKLQRVHLELILRWNLLIQLNSNLLIFYPMAQEEFLLSYVMFGLQILQRTWERFVAILFPDRWPHLSIKCALHSTVTTQVQQKGFCSGTVLSHPNNTANCLLHKMVSRAFSFNTLPLLQLYNTMHTSLLSWPHP